MMKILVPCKRVPDTDATLQVADDGRDIDGKNLTYILNPFDAIAVEEAIRVREDRQGRAEETEIVAVTIAGSDAEQELRTALAMGADRGLRVDVDHDTDPWNVANLLATVVRREQFDLVFIGKQAVDDDSGQVGQFLAAILDWPQATFASRIDVAAWPNLVVDRETDLGIETIALTGPSVITVDLRLNEPRYASLPSIMRARSKEIEIVTCQELGWDVNPRIEIIGMQAVSTTRNCLKVTSAEELVDVLHKRTEQSGA